MSKPIDDGVPAFPHHHVTCQRINESEYYEGMTLRDWFAGQALAGLISSPNVFRPERLDYAEAAYGFADAMLAARAGGAK